MVMDGWMGEWMVTADIRRSEGIQSVVGRARPRGPGPSVRLNNQEFNPSLAEPGVMLIPLIDLVRLALPPFEQPRLLMCNGVSESVAAKTMPWGTRTGELTTGSAGPGWNDRGGSAPLIQRSPCGLPGHPFLDNGS